MEKKLPEPDLAVLPTERELATVERLAVCLMPNCKKAVFRDSNRCEAHFKEWLHWLWKKVGD